MQKILGKEISQVIIERLKTQPAPKKIFAAVLVGDDLSSVHFVAQKEKLAKSLGIDFRIYHLSPTLKNDGLRKAVREIAEKGPVGGVIVQLPLPEGVSPRYVLNAVPPEKDVDVLGERALKLFYAGKSDALPPAVGTVSEILHRTSYDIRLARVTVIGQGLLVGKPIAHWLQGKAKEVVTFRSTSDNMREQLKDFDVIISGVGKARLFSADDIKDGALIIDFGWNTVDGKIRGDFSIELMC